MRILHQEKKGLAAASNLLPLFVLISLGLNVVALLISISLVARTSEISRRPAPSLVQLENGRSIAVEPVNRLHRTPKVTRQFVKEIMLLMFSWSAVSPSGSRRTITDEGVGIDDERITTKTWEAGFALSDDFRVPFLKKVGSMTPRDVFAGDAQSVLNITNLSNPRQVKPGVWELDMVATLLIFDQKHPQGKSIPFDKVITVIAVEPLLDPLPSEATPIQTAVYEIRSSGLQITSMYDLPQ